MPNTNRREVVAKLAKKAAYVIDLDRRCQTCPRVTGALAACHQAGFDGERIQQVLEKRAAADPAFAIEVDRFFGRDKRAAGPSFTPPGSAPAGGASGPSTPSFRPPASAFDPVHVPGMLESAGNVARQVPQRAWNGIGGALNATVGRGVQGVAGLARLPFAAGDAVSNWWHGTEGPGQANAFLGGMADYAGEQAQRGGQQIQNAFSQQYDPGTAEAAPATAAYDQYRQQTLENGDGGGWNQFQANLPSRMNTLGTGLMSAAVGAKGVPALANVGRGVGSALLPGAAAATTPAAEAAAVPAATASTPAAAAAAPSGFRHVWSGLLGGIGTAGAFKAEDIYKGITEPERTAVPAPPLNAQQQQVVADAMRLETAKINAMRMSPAERQQALADRQLELAHHVAALRPEELAAALPGNTPAATTQPQPDAQLPPQALIERGRTSLATALQKIQSDPSLQSDPSKVIPEFEPAIRDMVQAHAAQAGIKDPAALLDHYLKDGAQPRDVTELQRLLSVPGNSDVLQQHSGATGPGSMISAMMGFFQNPEIDPIAKAAVGIGIPMGIVGLLSSLFGEGGLGSLLMSVLGIGAAGYGASQAGLLGPGGLGGLLGLGGEDSAPQAPSASTQPGAPGAAGPQAGQGIDFSSPQAAQSTLGYLTQLPPEARQAALFPANASYQSQANRLAELSKHYDVPQLQSLLKGYAPKQLNQLRSSLPMAQQLFGKTITPEVAQELQQALGS